MMLKYIRILNLLIFPALISCASTNNGSSPAETQIDYSYQVENEFASSGIKKLIGKTIWYVPNQFICESVPEIKKYSALKVTRVFHSQESISHFSDGKDIGFKIHFDFLIGKKEGMLTISSRMDHFRRNEINCFTLKNPRSSNISTTDWNKIKDEKVAIGFTKKQVRLSWGEPNSISSSTTAQTQIEIWHYGNIDIVFKNEHVFKIDKF